MSMPTVTTSDNPLIELFREWLRSHQDLIREIAQEKSLTLLETIDLMLTDVAEAYQQGRE